MNFCLGVPKSLEVTTSTTLTPSDKILSSRFVTPSSANCSITWARWVHDKILEESGNSFGKDSRSCQDSRKGKQAEEQTGKTPHNIISYNVLRKAAWTTLTFAEIHTSMFKMFTFIYHGWCAPTNDDNSWPEWQMPRLPALLAACLGELCKCAGPSISSTHSLWTYILHARNSCPQRNHPNWKVFGSITYHSMPFHFRLSRWTNVLEARFLPHFASYTCIYSNSFQYCECPSSVCDNIIPNHHLGSLKWL